MTFAIVSGFSSHEFAYKLSIISKVPICRLLSRQKLNQKLQVIASEKFYGDEIFILISSAFYSSYLNDALMELLFVVNIFKHKSKAKLTIGNETKFS